MDRVALDVEARDRAFNGKKKLAAFLPVVTKRPHGPVLGAGDEVHAAL
jgi:hypothetical protein